jgi:hypothetical protein
MTGVYGPGNYNAIYGRILLGALFGIVFVG